MVDCIRRMLLFVVAVVVLMGATTSQASTVNPNAVRTGMGATASNTASIPIVFYQGFDGNLWGTYQSGSSWQSVYNYGTPNSTVGITSSIGTLYAPGSGWEVWVKGTDGNLWCAYQSGASYAWVSRGTPTSTVGIASAIGAFYVTGSGWEVWVIGTDGNLWCAYQTGASYAWVSRGTPTSTVGIASTIGAFYVTGSGWEVWVKGTDGKLWCAYQSGASYAWVSRGTPSSTVGISSAIGALYASGSGWEVWVIGTDGNLWCAYQSGASYAWVSRGTPTNTDGTTATDSYGIPVQFASAVQSIYVLNIGWRVFVTGSDSNLWCAEQTGLTWNWANLTNASVEQSQVGLKYQILGVDYAPPGAKSTVTYAGTQVRGTKTTNTETFDNTVTVSSQITFSGASLGINSAYSESHSNSTSNAISITNSTSNIVPGPASSSEGVNHDYDIIWVWLNPSVKVTVTGPNSVLWGGYTINPQDPANEMVVVPLYVSWLKNPSTIPPGTAQLLARTWDTSGRGGLTSDDYSVILAANPLAIASSTPYNPNTDGNHRFDLQTSNLNSGTSSTVSYQPPPAGGQPTTQTFSVQSVNTSTQGQGAQYRYSVGITTGYDAGLGNLLSANSKLAYTYTTTNGWSSEVTVGSGNTSSFSITGPAVSDNYTGPTQFQVWRDNVFGSYMFYPVPN